MRKTAIVWETIGLSSPRGRLLFFILVTVAVFVLPPKWPVNLSLWSRLNIPSPSIGMTRAYLHLIHGDFRAAWQRNKLIYPVVVIGGAILIRDIRLSMSTVKIDKPKPDC